MSKKERNLGNKAVSVYVSWVLIVAFVLVLSGLMFSFMTGYTKESAEKIKERALTQTECDSVAVTIDSACQNTQDLYINVTNRGDIEVVEAIFRIYDLYYEPQINQKEISLLIGKYNSKELNLVKRGAVKKVRKIEIVPMIISEGVSITCESKMAYYPADDNPISDCLNY